MRMKKKFSGTQYEFLCSIYDNEQQTFCIKYKFFELQNLRGQFSIGFFLVCVLKIVFLFIVLVSSLRTIFRMNSELLNKIV